MQIRPFVYQDLDEIIRIATVSFSRENKASGLSNEDFIKQVRTATMGRMIPLRVLGALTGFQMNIYVAEVDDRLVGMGMWSGFERMELSSLMVDPAFRRRGVGQAITEARLDALRRAGHNLVTSRVLSDNQASLANLAKQGFEEFDRTVIFERELPLDAAEEPYEGLSWRPVGGGDQEAFKRLEQETVSPQRFEIVGSALRQYLPSIWSRMFNRLATITLWQRAFLLNDEPIGLMVAQNAKRATKGYLYQPLLLDVHLEHLPAMLNIACAWLTGQGKQAVQLPVSTSREELVGLLREHHWREKYEWLWLYRRL